MKRAPLATLLASLFASVVVCAAEDAKPAAPDAPATPSTKPDESGASKFYGTVAAIDTKAGTFTVGDQTFKVVGHSSLTKAADGSPATLADAKVGEPARGTYTKRSDGTLEITKVRFGKKVGGGKKSKEGATKPNAE